MNDTSKEYLSFPVLVMGSLSELLTVSVRKGFGETAQKWQGRANGKLKRSSAFGADEIASVDYKDAIGFGKGATQGYVSFLLSHLSLSSTIVFIQHFRRKKKSLSARYRKLRRK